MRGDELRLRRCMELVLDRFASLGLSVRLFLDRIGRFSRFASRTLTLVFTQPSTWMRWRQIGPLLYSVGASSVIVVSITGAFIGMILALEGFDQFAALGQEAQMGGVIAAAVVKQIGPVLAAVMLAGRVGGALAAELGTMKVTEQLDAMRAMSADPIKTLVVPRVVACVIMTPILTIYSDLLGILGSFGIICGMYGVTRADYWYSTTQFLSGWDPLNGVIKSLAFGLAIGLISCYRGFRCEGGAAGVGRASTQSFVASFLTIIVVNLLLAQFLQSLQRWIDPETLRTLAS
ncbi:MAG: ABC transporter permease [Planctomycetota bacterium]|nr:MAG: ABC transporter permease [Planctomycetota bacterium]